MNFADTNGPIPEGQFDPITPSRNVPNPIPTKDEGPLDLPLGPQDVPGAANNPRNREGS